MIFPQERSLKLSLGLVEVGDPKTRHSLAKPNPLCFLPQPTTQVNQLNPTDQLNLIR